MGVLSDAAVSRGDLMHEIAELKRRLQAVETARRLESAKIGRGGLRIQGGRLLAEDADGERVFEVTTIPPQIFMRPELIQNVVEAILTSPAGRALAAGIFADRIHHSFAAATVSTTSGSFVSLAGGPTVPNVEISPAGAALVAVGAGLNVVNSETTSRVGVMSFEISGATSLGPGVGRSYEVGHQNSGSDISRVQGAATTFVPVTGLSAGTHTFEAKYAVSTTGLAVGFSSRHLVVIAL